MNRSPQVRLIGLRRLRNRLVAEVALARAEGVGGETGGHRLTEIQVIARYDMAPEEWGQMYIHHRYCPGCIVGEGA